MANFLVIRLLGLLTTQSGDLLMKKMRFSFFLTCSCILLAACGGGAGKDSSDSLSTNPSDDIEPTITPTSVPTTTPTTDPINTPIPEPTPTTNPILQEGRPVLSVNVDENSLQLNWTDVDAENYRILYWREGGATVSNQSSDLQFISSEITEPGEYTFIVEANDSLGNSFFSEPVFLELD